MKKILIPILFLFCMFSVPIIHPVFAQDFEETTVVLNEENVASSPSTIQTKAEYLLPYPGMLPDHPLYFLKRFRDYLLEKLISDPLKKTEFFILQADKRLQMGIFLQSQGKDVLAETTISKGEKYFDEALRLISSYRKMTGSIPSYVIEKFEASLDKHEQIIQALQMTAPDVTKKGFGDSLQFVQSMKNEVAKLK